jgi:hypothetical protein
MRFCRKIFASYRGQSAIEPEIIDLLQGRGPKSVFARHYFTPSLEYRDKVIRALDNLKQQMDEE